MQERSVKGTRHGSANAIGGRQEMQCRHMLLFARGHLGFDNAVCVVLWVGAAGCQKRYSGWLLFTSKKKKTFVALGPSALIMNLILDLTHGLHFGIWMTVANWIPFGGLSNL